MWQCDNLLISTDVQSILQDIRAEAFTKYDLNYFRDIKIVNNHVMTNCAFHKNGQERKPSAGIDMTTGFYHCFTCGAAMPFTKFVSRVLFNSNDEDKGKKWLKQNYVDTEFVQRQGLPLTERKKYEPTKFVSEEELDKYRYIHPYMYKRHLTDKIIEKFDIGYDKDTNCITFPVNDISGNCVFVARRSVQGKFYNYPLNADKPVYALDKCVGLKSVIVVESFINALTLWGYNMPAIALIGTGSTTQFDILNKCSFRHYILCFDGDNAGRLAVKRFVRNINQGTFEVVTMPEGKDVNDLSYEEFMQCYNARKQI